MPDEIVALCEQRAKMARAIHSMMLQMIKARADAERVSKGDAVEVGFVDSDDVGDDPWSSHRSMFVPHLCSGEG